MNNEQIVLINESFALLMRVTSQAFVKYFMVQLATENSMLVALFDEMSIKRHTRMIASIITLAKDGIDEGYPQLDLIRSIWKAHYFLDIAPILISNYIEILLESVSTYLGEAWTDDMHNLWTQLLRQIALVMTTEFDTPLDFDNHW